MTYQSLEDVLKNPHIFPESHLPRLTTDMTEEELTNLESECDPVDEETSVSRI